MHSSLRTPLLRLVESELHDLCQPVTALQCRLELGRMEGSGEAALAALDGALEDVTRLFAAIATMRAQLQEADAAAAGEVVPCH